MKKGTITNNTWYAWYDWLSNYFSGPIKKHLCWLLLFIMGKKQNATNKVKNDKRLFEKS